MKYSSASSTANKQCSYTIKPDPAASAGLTGQTSDIAPKMTDDYTILKEFISGQLGQGFTVLEIKEALLMKNWDEELVDRAFRDAMKLK